MNTINDFVLGVQKMAVSACLNTKLFPSLMLAQAILESNAGKSKLSLLHHNYFGIKASTGWNGKRVLYNTTEYINSKPVKIPQYFRSYSSVEEGFADRIRFLQVNKRYTTHGVFTSKTPEEQAKAFFKAGYATDPAYPDKLNAIIHKYGLKKYDS